MSDFLNHLVGRSFGSAEAVRPRTISVFEPDPAPRPQSEPPFFVAGPAPHRSEDLRNPNIRARSVNEPVAAERPRLYAATETLLEIAEPLGSPSVDANVYAVPRPAKPMASIARRRLEEPEDRGGLPHTAPVASVAAPREPARKVRQRPVEDGFVTESASSTNSAGLSTASPTPLLERPRLSNGALDAAHERPFAPEHAKVDWRPTPRVFAPSPELATVRSPSASTPPIPTSLESKVVCRQARGAPEARGGGRRQGAEATIEITIGRIEVRAEAAATGAPAKPRSAGTPVSLGDYLRQRAGKER